MKKLLIMTPAYNEEKNIGEVLEGIEKAVENLHNPNPNLDLDYEIIVVNDGSTDNTANIANKQSKYAGVITHPINLGLGAARPLRILCTYQEIQSSVN